MKAFISYSHKDEWALKRLHTHLAVLRRDGRIDIWYDRKILAGGDIDQEISEQLETFTLFLPLVSPDFLASDYCYDQEMKRALKRHATREVRVIPIIIEPCDWQNSPLGQLKAIPKDGKPITTWKNDNEAFLNIVTELRRILPEKDTAVVTDSNQTHIISAVTDTNHIHDGSRYRIKRDFDQIAQSDFREQAFETICSYFKTAIDEINSINGIRGRFRVISNQSFSCTIINQNLAQGAAHITVHTGNGPGSLGDIYYSFSENAPTNIAHGWFYIKSDEYSLFLQHTRGERLSAQEAAKLLWTQFIQQVGVLNV